MRLTLRTLLAYMDDVLDPDHAREIGNKVNASANASALVNRIREVVRRRRLLAPELAGPQSGLDPNTIAEYLDSTLDADTVAEVEKVCLDSDMHLAEVAACHQVLTIVLGEPVDVPVRTRERMYALGPSRQRAASVEEPSPASASTVPPMNPPPEPERTPVRPVTMSLPKPTVEGFEDGVPDYLKPAPFWKRALPVAVAIVLVGGWAIMMYRELNGRTPSDPSRATVASGAPNANPKTDEDSAAVDAHEDAQVRNAAPKNAEPFVAAPMSNGPDDGNEKFTRRPLDQVTTPLDAARPSNKTPAVEPEPKTTIEKPAPMKTPLPMPEAVAKVDEPKPMPEKPAVPVEAAVMPGPEVVYTARSGRLVQRTANGWTVMPYRSTIRRGDRVCSPYPFSALFEIASLGLTIELLPGSSMEFGGATAQEAIVLEVPRGRVSFKRAAQAGANPLTIGLRLAGESCQLTMLSEQSLCGMEITPREPDSLEMDLGEDRMRGHLAVVTSDVRFTSMSSGEEKLGPQSWFSLALRDRKQTDPARRLAELVVIPDWLDANKPRMTATERTYATQFEKKVDPDLSLAESVSGLVNEKSQMLSTFAVKALAATELHTELVKALAKAEFEETRVAAIVGLRQWLPLAPRNRELLKEELAQNFAADHVDAIYRLLWGFNEDDARSPASSRILFDWLSHENSVIRHLAFYHIYHLTGQKYDYRPVSPAPQRNAAIERWHMHMERNKGALVN